MSVFQGLSEVGGPDTVASLMVRHRYSNNEANEVVSVVGAGVEPPVQLENGPARRRWLFHADPDRLRTFGRLWVAKARLDARRWDVDPRPVLDLLASLRREREGAPPLRLEDLAVNGRDLIAQGLKPGPQFGGILSRLMDHVLEDPELNTKEALLTLVPELARAEEEEG
jgi:hypothetical protein